MPVKVIMPPASAPKMRLRRRSARSAGCRSPTCSSRTGRPSASTTRPDVGGQHREPHRRAEPDPQAEDAGRRRGPRAAACVPWLTPRRPARPCARAAIRRMRRPCSGPASVDSAPAPDERGGGRGAHVPVVDRDRRDRHHERQLRRGEQRERHAVLPQRQHAAVEQHRRRAADDQEQHEEDRELRDAGRAREQRVDVEAHPAHDEEERDEDAERDRGELRVERRDLARLRGPAA